MSTDAATLAGDTPRYSDLGTVRTIRFTLGTTASAAIAFAYEWPLSFLTPVLTIVFLSKTLPGFDRRRLDLVAYVLAAMALGTLFTLFLLPFPLAYVPLLGLALFNVYYLVNRGGPFIFALMSLLALLILPLLGSVHEQLALAFAGYFAFSATLAIALFALAHAVLPDPPGTPGAPQAAFRAGYAAPAARAALKSTLATLPIAIVFLALELESQLPVVVYAAILSLVPEAASGRAAGRQMLLSTLLGALAATVIYWAFVAVPEFHFLLALWLLAMLVFARVIFSQHPLAPYMGSAATAMTILVAGSFDAGDFLDKMAVRVVLIVVATLYVTAALALLGRWLPNPEARRPAGAGSPA